MSLSLYVVGYAEPDFRWRQMKAAFDACKVAGVNPPKEVWDFFGDTPSEDGVHVKLPVTEFADDYYQGYILKVEDIPPSVKLVKFYVS
jgi:hypothetical protein